MSPTTWPLGRIEPGQIVVDLGCGAGTDLLIAAQMTGPRGRVIGVDMSTAMVEQARARATPRARRAAPRVTPGGELRSYEPVIPTPSPKRLLLQAADHSSLWPRIAGGCHPARDTAAAIERAGFEIQGSERIKFAASRLEPPIPHILGTARRT